VEDNIEVSEDFINQFNSLLDLAIKELEQDNFVEARRLVKQAETLLEDVDDDAEEQEDEEDLAFEQVGLGNLCSGSAKCNFYCIRNSYECKEYCRNNLENKMCQQLFAYKNAEEFVEKASGWFK